MTMDIRSRKKYVITASAIFGVAFLLTLVIAVSLVYTDHSRVDMSLPVMALVSLGAGVATAGSYTGFVALFSPVEKLSNRSSVLLVVFCAPIVVLTNIVGIIILVPYYAYSLHKIIKK